MKQKLLLHRLITITFFIVFVFAPKMFFAQSIEQNFENDVLYPDPYVSPKSGCNAIPDNHYFNQLATWIPPANAPNKVLKVNFNIFTDPTDPDKNFQPASEDGGASVSRLNQIFIWLRDYYLNNGTPSDPDNGNNRFE